MFTSTGGGAAEQQKVTKQEQQQNSSESCDSDPGSATHDSDSEDEGTEDYKKGQLCLSKYLSADDTICDPPPWENQNLCSESVSMFALPQACFRTMHVDVTLKDICCLP